MISVDTETNYTDRAWERYCLGISLTTDVNSYYIPVAHKTGWLGTPSNIEIPTDLFDGITVPIIAHNMKFDYQVLRKLGINLPTRNLQDTMVMSHFICEWNKGKNQGHSLEIVAPKYLGKQSQKEVAKAKALKPVWEITPPYLMAQYAEQDARLLPELYTKLLSIMEPDWIRQWEEVDREFMLLLADMETLGLPIDRELAEKYQEQCVNRMWDIRQELGFDPAKPSQLHPKLFCDPPFGLGLKCSQLTPTGKPKVDLPWLQSVGHPMTALVYEYRKTQKQVSSYFSPYLTLTTREDARLHCDFRQYGTQTGRMSCADPNLQQIPRQEYEGSSVKKVFNPEEGMQLWEIDFRTLEYRMMAVYSKEPKLLEIFRNEGDFHQMVADDVGVSRDTAKHKINYSIAYGAGATRIAQGIMDWEQRDMTWSQAKDIVTKVKNTYPLLFRKMNEAQEYAEQAMEIRMWFGRKRHFQWPGECHKAFNAIIQGGSFEIVKRSMLLLRAAGFTMSNQVHDSVWLNVLSEADVIEAQKIMEGWTEEFFGLKFSTDRKRLK